MQKEGNGMIETYTIILAAIGAVTLADKLGGLILRLYREGLENE
jgi:hypothetical protein